MDLTGKRVVVVGLGSSGIAAARLCARRGARVLGTDSAGLSELSKEVSELGVELALGGHPASFVGFDLVVVSPGVGPLPALEAAGQAGVEVIGELELAWRHLSAPVIAVGGTNGKSTVTTVVARLLEGDRMTVFAGGNLGRPASEAAGGSWDAVVLEVSSFQLERAPTFKPKVAVLLNITEDHLDRYSDFAQYARAKGNAFANQTTSDTAVIWTGDPECARQARRGKGRLLRFHTQRQDADFYVEGREVMEASTGLRFSLERVPLHGLHNLLNAAAAIAAARAFGVSAEGIQAGFLGFEPLPHRTELVGSIAGVTFYDDSKATNVGASVNALRGLQEPRAVLIAGGRDKLGGYEPLVEALREKGRALVVIGEAASKIASAVGSAVPVEQAATLVEAVASAYRLALPGDAVLLSPACSSFDMFKSYADRGEQFARAVRSLQGETTP
jgi:UDP-N-acetylmuramoylalanine--D-glutamate ligase